MRKLLIVILLLTIILISGCNGARTWNTDYEYKCQKECVDIGLSLNIVQYADNDNIMCICEKRILLEIGE